RETDLGQDAGVGGRELRRLLEGIGRLAVVREPREHATERDVELLVGRERLDRRSVAGRSLLVFAELDLHLRERLQRVSAARIELDRLGVFALGARDIAEHPPREREALADVCVARGERGALLERVERLRPLLAAHVSEAEIDQEAARRVSTELDGLRVGLGRIFVTSEALENLAVTGPELRVLREALERAHVGARRVLVLPRLCAGRSQEGEHVVERRIQLERLGACADRLVARSDLASRVTEQPPRERIGRQEARRVPQLHRGRLVLTGAYEREPERPSQRPVL